MPKLTDLKGRFIRAVDAKSWEAVPTIATAQGIQFKCPACLKITPDPHSIICWSESRGAPVDIRPLPGRWALQGTSLEDLTLNGEIGRSRSIQLTGGCAWHGYITDGEVTDA